MYLRNTEVHMLHGKYVNSFTERQVEPEAPCWSLCCTASQRLTETEGDLHNPQYVSQWPLFTADILTCASRKSTSVNNMNYG